MSEIKLVKRIKFAGDVHAALMQLGWDAKTAAAFLDSIPDADAVEVVRCKDCKHSRERNEYEKNYLVEGVRVCTHPECSGDCWYATWPDHWCSYGERRDD